MKERGSAGEEPIELTALLVSGIGDGASGEAERRSGYDGQRKLRLRSAKKMRGMKRDVNERKMGSKTSFGEKKGGRGRETQVTRDRESESRWKARMGWTHSKSPGTLQTRRRTSSRSSISSQGVQYPTTFAARKKEDPRDEAEDVNFSGARKARDFSGDGEKEKRYYVEFPSGANRGVGERARTSGLSSAREHSLHGAPHHNFSRQKN